MFPSNKLGKFMYGTKDYIIIEAQAIPAFTSKNDNKTN